ncbi:uncharacterized protein LOC107636748 [Arachis ipaensis]|uniref:uncharacterized protein LOC107636748 n=1 Tax=Arachis ipaensis TaxID=130454 RepID=UPI0007AFD216|nr:uncharacterized protein LOC107636748 [Arachis ipaensis]
MSKRMDGLQLAAVSTTNQPSMVWGHQEESCEELQPEQLSKQAVTERPTNALPSDTIFNPKEECKAIQLRSGRTLVNNKKPAEKEATKKPIEDDKASSSKEQVTIEEKNQERLKEKEEPQASMKRKQIMEEQSQEQRKIVKTYTPPLPYPQRLQKEIKDQQFPKFLEVFKKLEINIPLVEALEQMPLYVKFLKELISKKRSWNEREIVILTQECSALIQEGIPPKFKDPGSFYLPCTIGNTVIDKALCDLGSSINLMPLSMMRRLSIEEVKPTQMSLELVDRSLVIPEGVIENLLVRVEKFIFPADFIILDLGEEENDSLILGRPFLATTRAIIDVEQGELNLRVNDEKINLNVFQEVHHTVKEKSCMRVEEEDLPWKEKPNEEFISSSAKQEMKSGEEKEGKEHVKAEKRR